MSELIRLEVGPVAAGGSCVARHEGRVVFVRHALPGEVVLARLTDPVSTAESAAESRRRYWRADAVTILSASPDRVAAPCPASGPGGCGGCDWQHATLAAQRRGKAALVGEQLRRLAGIDWPGLEVEAPGQPKAAMDDDGLGWRTRMRFAVDPAGHAGLRVHRSHTVVPLADCPIAHPGLAVPEITKRNWSSAAAVEVTVGAGGPPLVIVEPVQGGRVEVPPLPSNTSVAGRTGGTKGSGKSARPTLIRLRGRTWVEQEVTVAGQVRRFRVSHAGFWQVHPAAAQLLADAVRDAVDLRSGERAVDLYSGVGLFTAVLAAATGPGGRVLAIESDPRAAADARRNLHDLRQVQLEQGRVERALPVAAASLSWAGRADVVVLDPPRAGAGRAVIAAICALRPRRIGYVACDPAALARDVALAAAGGYRLAALRAFDLFPMTHHVECLATLQPSS